MVPFNGVALFIASHCLRIVQIFGVLHLYKLASSITRTHRSRVFLLLFVLLVLTSISSSSHHSSLHLLNEGIQKYYYTTVILNC